uniref:Uncharacterized protein n=1 Tax=viral metagenome TaxID=1070528 RepID=A0A6M3LDR9_9ZZZZ
MELTRRYRVNVGTSVKGVKSYDCTVEITCDELNHEQVQCAILTESDSLVAQLDQRYPSTISIA